MVAVGADREGIEGLGRAQRAGIPTFALKVKDFESREEWDAALAGAVAAYDPDIVVLAGFMKLVGSTFLALYGGKVVNTHPALSPSFPGMHGPADALAYGVKVTGATLFVVDPGRRHRPDHRPAGGRGGRGRHRRDAARADQGGRARDARGRGRADGPRGLRGRGAPRPDRPAGSSRLSAHDWRRWATTGE